MATTWKDQLKILAPDLYKRFEGDEWMLAATALLALPRTPELEQELGSVFKKLGRTNLVSELKAIQQFAALRQQGMGMGAPPFGQPGISSMFPGGQSGWLPAPFAEMARQNRERAAQIGQMLPGSETPAVPPEELVMQYHRNIIASNLQSIDTKTGNIVTTAPVIITARDGPHKGKPVVVPSYVPGKGIVSDSQTLWNTWKNEINRGRFPVLGSYFEAASTATKAAWTIAEETAAIRPTPDDLLKSLPIANNAFLDAVGMNVFRMLSAGRKPDKPLPKSLEPYVPEAFRKAGMPLYELAQFAHDNGFKVTSGYSVSGHNVGSKHYKGLAIDVSVKGKTSEEVQRFIAKARESGFKVVDERTKPKGQAVWTGPHLHLEWQGPSSQNEVVRRASPDKRFAEFQKRTKEAAATQGPGPTPHELWAATVSGYQRFIAKGRALITRLDGLIAQMTAGTSLNQVPVAGSKVSAAIEQELQSMGLNLRVDVGSMDAEQLGKLKTVLGNLVDRAVDEHSELVVKPPKRTPKDIANWYGWDQPHRSDAEKLWAAEVLYGTGGEPGALGSLTKSGLGAAFDIGRGYPANWYQGAFNLVTDAVAYLFYGAPQESTIDLAPLYYAGSYPGVPQWSGLGTDEKPRNAPKALLEHYASAYEKITGKKVEATPEALRKAAAEVMSSPSSSLALPLWDMAHGPVELTSGYFGLSGEGASRAYRLFNNLAFGIPGIITGLGVGRPVLLDREYDPGMLENTAFLVLDAAGTVGMLVATGGVGGVGRAAGAAAAKTGEKIAAMAIPKVLQISQPIARKAALRTTERIVNGLLSREAVENATKLGLFFGVQESTEELAQQLGMGTLEVVPVLQAGVSAFFLGAATGVVGSKLAGISPLITRASKGAIPLGASEWAMSFAAETATYASLMPTLSTWGTPEGFHWVAPGKEDWLAAFAMVGLSRTLGRVTDVPYITSRLESLAEAAAKRFRGEESDFHIQAEELIEALPEEERAGALQALRKAVGIVINRNFVKNTFANMRTHVNRLYREDEEAAEGKAAAREATLAWYASNIHGPVPPEVEAFMLRHKGKRRVRPSDTPPGPRRPEPGYVGKVGDEEIVFPKGYDGDVLQRRRQQELMLAEFGFDVNAEYRILTAIQNPLVRKELQEMGVDTDALVARAKLIGVWANDHIPFAIHDAEHFKVMAEALERNTGLKLTDLLVEDDHIIILDNTNVQTLMGVRARRPNKRQGPRTRRDGRARRRPQQRIESDIATPGVYRWDGEMLHYVGPTGLPEYSMSTVLWNHAMEEFAAHDAQAIIDRARLQADGEPPAGDVGAAATEVGGEGGETPPGEGVTPEGGGAEAPGPGAESGPTDVGPTDVEPQVGPETGPKVEPQVEPETGPTVGPAVEGGGKPERGKPTEVKDPVEALSRINKDIAEAESRVTQLETEVEELTKEVEQGPRIPGAQALGELPVQEQARVIREAGAKYREAEARLEAKTKELKDARNVLRQLKKTASDLERQVRAEKTKADAEQKATLQAAKQEHKALQRDVEAAKRDFGIALRELRRLAGKARTTRSALNRAIIKSGVDVSKVRDLTEAARKALRALSDDSVEKKKLEAALEDYVATTEELEVARDEAERTLKDYDDAWEQYKKYGDDNGLQALRSLAPPTTDEIGKALETETARRARTPLQAGGGTKDDGAGLALHDTSGLRPFSVGTTSSKAGASRQASQEADAGTQQQQKRRSLVDMLPGAEVQTPEKATEQGQEKATRKKKVSDTKASPQEPPTPKKKPTPKTKEKPTEATEKKPGTQGSLRAKLLQLRELKKQLDKEGEQQRQESAKESVGQKKVKPTTEDAKKASRSKKTKAKENSVESKLGDEETKGRPLESDPGTNLDDLNC